MSGYREHSFDPNAGGGAYGPPLRPYNWVQWTGVAFMVAGVGLFLAVVATQLGWISQKFEDSFPAATSLLVIGSLLVNSRRAEVSTEEMARRRRGGLIALAVALAVCALAAATIFYFQGA